MLTHARESRREADDSIGESPCVSWNDLGPKKMRGGVCGEALHRGQFWEAHIYIYKKMIALSLYLTQTHIHIHGYTAEYMDIHT